MFLCFVACSFGFFIVFCLFVFFFVWFDFSLLLVVFLCLFFWGFSSFLFFVIFCVVCNWSFFVLNLYEALESYKDLYARTSGAETKNS